MPGDSYGFGRVARTKVSPKHNDLPVCSLVAIGCRSGAADERQVTNNINHFKAR